MTIYCGRKWKSVCVLTMVEQNDQSVHIWVASANIQKESVVEWTDRHISDSGDSLSDDDDDGEKGRMAVVWINTKKSI
jgi:hypothetical protein